MDPDQSLSDEQHQQETWLASFPEKNPNPILEISLDGCIEYTNPAIRKIFPTLTEQNTDHPYLAGWEAIVRQYRNQADLVLSREVQVGEEYFQQSIHFVQEYQRLRVYGMKITERKRLEKEIIESEKKYRELVQSAPAGIYEVDFRTQRFISVNDAMCILTGYSREELMGMNPLDVLDEPSQQVFRGRIQKWLAGEMPEQNVEYCVLAKDGHEIYAELEVTFTTNRQGKPFGATVIAHDVTERKRLLKEVLNQAVELETVISSIGDGVIIRGPSGSIRRMNPAAERILGFTAEELSMSLYDRAARVLQFRTETGRRFTDLRDLPVSRALRGEAVQNVLLEMTNERTGQKAWLYVNESPLRTPHEEILGTVIAVTDITERKQVEEALRLSQERERKRTAELEAVMEALPVGMLITDEKGGVVQSNAAFLKVWGGNLPKTQSVEDYPAYKAWWADTGKEVSPEEWASAQAVQKGKTIVGQMIQIQRFDGTRAHIYNSASPVRDAEGKIFGSAVAIQDVTELQEAKRALADANAFLEQRVQERTAELERSAIELQKAEEELTIQNEELAEALETEKSLRNQLIQAEKYAALARLLGSVAHEINNPLQTVKNSLYLLTPAIPPGDMQRILEIAIQESRRIGALVQQLHETYRRSDIRPVECNLNDILRKVHTLLEPQLKHNDVQWQFQTEQDPLHIRAIPDQIHQVCMNICINAIDAMGPEGGQLTVGVTRPDVEKVCISFHNTGPGIPESDQARIFEPFFTTKEKGLGLGLAICQEIVKGHGGEITVESEPGNGTTFKVWLPIE